MCGIVGVATTAGRRLSVERGGLEAMRDRLAHRGPDGEGIWWGGHVALGHRRLAVIETGPEGLQPMLSECGRHVLVYNGELYNDLDLRDRMDMPPRGGSDTRTVLRVLAHERDLVANPDPGPGARLGLAAMRGMYALAWYDRDRDVLTLARDPLGIKPLLYWKGRVPGGGEEVVFASEVTALMGHPYISARPDWAVVSSYLTTIRTTLGHRTLFEGVRTVEPGEVIEFDLSGTRIVERRRHAGRPGFEPWTADPIARLREVISDSVEKHLRSHVPLAVLLSGGLDSTVVCAEARARMETLPTYCAGARDEVAEGGLRSALSPDFKFAAMAAHRLQTRHAERAVTRGLFGERWRWMVDRLGLPLSTPNEVAIYEVAAALRADGNEVALSGEGADEMLGGYDRPLLAMSTWGTAALVSRPLEALGEDAGAFMLDHAAWMTRDAKERLMSAAMWEFVEHDAALIREYREGFAACVREAETRNKEGGAEGEELPIAVLLQATLLHQQRVNLVGLLGRLDGATMLASVEGRTPLADVCVAELCRSLPMRLKFEAGLPTSADSTGSSGIASEAEVGGVLRPAARLTMGSAGFPGTPTRTKIALRRSYEGMVPGEILRREKASFPLPFQGWLGDMAAALEGSDLVASVFEPEAIERARTDPGGTWSMSWPMLNLALWGRRWGW